MSGYDHGHGLKRWSESFPRKVSPEELAEKREPEEKGAPMRTRPIHLFPVNPAASTLPSLPEFPKDVSPKELIQRFINDSKIMKMLENDNRLTDADRKAIIWEVSKKSLDCSGSTLGDIVAQEVEKHLSKKQG